jgi:hypothetical protein
MYSNIIAIPFRNRESHLKYFIDNTVPLIQECLPNTRVVVIEQNEGKLFNRGALLNVAFKEYENKTKYFFTHDVDINPTKKCIEELYSRDVDILKIKSAHEQSLGGLVKFSHDIFIKSNGFPNNIWGWGIEDRALYYRCCMKNLTITKNNGNYSFKTMPHTSNAIQYIGEKKQISDIWTKPYIDRLDNKEKEELIMSSGLNNLEYTMIERKMLHDIVEVIKVEI